MIKVFIEAEAGAFEKGLYNEKTLEYKGTRRVILPYPFPYGFITGTTTENGDSVDCYIITNESLKAGQIYECEPIGLLEQKEDDEIDNKVLACMPGHKVKADQKILGILQNFIYGVFKEFPETTIKVGKFLPEQEALEYIKKYRNE